jgi:glycerol-3-phosphate cytidylyltransferase-like family protein
MKIKKVAYSFVMADLVHYGHIKLLSTGRRVSDYHICGLVSDEACMEWQGTTVCNYSERKKVLASLECVDEVIKQHTMDPLDNIRKIQKRFPDARIIVVHGDDWRTLPGIKYIRSIGGKVIQPKYYRQLSRDSIVKKFYDSTPYHPLKHEHLTRHIMLGNVYEYIPRGAPSMLRTKADTLKNFLSLLKSCVIEKIFTFTVGDYRRNKRDIIDSIRREFRDVMIIVRSSAAAEDRFESSNAGVFRSVSDVDSTDGLEIAGAVESVLDSYRRLGLRDPGTQVLVQTQITDVKQSGVVFTRNLLTNTPYYYINYDDKTGKTCTVTGGETESKSSWLYRQMDVEDYPPRWRALLRAVREIEEHLPAMVLDIEYAEKSDGNVVIFQIRPLAANVKYLNFDNSAFHELLKKSITEYERDGLPFLSDMAFWNPSEIIGDNPHPLDYSLYREVVTSGAWNRGLLPLGYTPVNRELMCKFGNKPYIYLTRAFTALTPDSLGEGLKGKLNAYYVEKLKGRPSAHDKIEFEIVLSCYTFETGRMLEELINSGFTASEVREIEHLLGTLTVDVVKGHDRRLKHGLRGLRTLARRRDSLRKNLSRCGDPFVLTDCALRLLREINLHGTPQFSGVAREAFMASALCKSLVSTNIYTEGDIDAFMEGINTVASEFKMDFQRFVSGEFGRERFMRKYGHLRAGTYDISSRTYEDMDFFSIPSAAAGDVSGRKGLRATGHGIKLETARLKDLLKGTPLSGLSTGNIIRFIRSSIVQREHFKFEFTKSLSLAIEFIARAGEVLGFGREEMCYLDVPMLRAAGFYSGERELRDFWRISLQGMKEEYEKNSRLVLPPVIDGEMDFRVISLEEARPNFITQRSVSGEVLNLDLEPGGNVRGKVVLLTKADPGFDWIFTQKIKGLITKYGGAASHMAIRCAEFNVPAAIGCGDRIFSQVSAWSRVRLNCRRKKLQPADGTS